MQKPLEGVKVVEVAMWAFVPACGGILSDMGASVTKVEPPTGDPLRGLQIGPASKSQHGFVVSWENYNRGKRSITLDLKQASGREVLYKLLADADVFLTNLLPAARRSMGIDVDDIRARFPKIIYAVGSGFGRRGEEAEKGGYDSIVFWARGGIASAATPEDIEYPITQPGAAFGDVSSGAMLAGGIAAALYRRTQTGEGGVVDVSLLAASMWVMQRGIVEATLEGILRFPRPTREQITNPLVNYYQTKDKRFLALCMLQGQRYWPGFCDVAGRPDLIEDPRFANDKARVQNIKECVAELDALFRTKTLAEWAECLSKQDGQWDIVKHVGEIKDDGQAKANGYLQRVEYEDGRAIDLVSVPMQFDGAPLPSRPAPALGAHSDEVLTALGYSEEQIIDLKVAGVVF